MDIGKIKDNYKFFENFDDEPEIIFESDREDMEILHVWEGYLDDISRDPDLEGAGWLGFTRDYHQCKGAFGDESIEVITNISEYLDDLKSYATRKFDYEDTKDVYDMLFSWLEEAINKKCKKIIVKVV